MIGKYFLSEWSYHFNSVLKVVLKKPKTQFFIFMKSNYFVAVLWVIFLDLIFKYVKHFLDSKVKRYAQIVSCPFHPLPICSHSCIYLCKS